MNGESYRVRAEELLPDPKRYPYYRIATGSPAAPNWRVFEYQTYEPALDRFDVEIASCYSPMKVVWTEHLGPTVIRIVRVCPNDGHLV